MARLGNYNRIYKQDYKPEFQDMIDTLSVNVNGSFDSIFNAFSNNINFADNFNATISNFTVTVDSTGKPLTPVTIKLNSYQTSINGILVINATGPTTNIIPTSGVFVNYTINNTKSSPTQNSTTKANPLSLSVTNVIGIPANQAFTINAIIL